MISQVILPKLGQTMEQGEIVEWVKKEGDPVQRGDLLFTVESDKAVLEVEASARGFLRKIVVPAGQKVPVLTVVALITTTADEEVSAPIVAATPGEVRAAQPEIAQPSTYAPTPGRLFASPRARKAAGAQGIELAGIAGSGPGGRIVERDVLAAAAIGPAPRVERGVGPAPRVERGVGPESRAERDEGAARVKATPMAARTAETLGVDLAAVAGSGISGRIMKADVEAAAAPTMPAAASSPLLAIAASVPVAGLRRIIAERMAASHHTTACVTLVTEVDATVLVEVREQLRDAVSEEWGFAPGYNDLLGLIVARALHEFPYMNARLSADGQAIEHMATVNVGLAVDTDRGLLVPVVRNADQKGLLAFGTELRILVERARTGRSLPDDLTGGTFTITNLGMYDVDAFTPIINPPEAAILGVGRIQPKPVVRGDQIVVRHMLTLSLAFDHRLVDGAPAAQFLQRIKRLAENPYLLLG